MNIEKLVKKTKEELIEERINDAGETIYTGNVKSYNAEKGFGFISIDDDITFNGTTAKGKIYVMKEDIICYAEEAGLNQDTKVIFKIYKDSLGLGACEVQNEDGTPITFQPADESAESVIEEAKKEEPEKVPVQTKKKRVTKRKTKKRNS